MSAFAVVPETRPWGDQGGDGTRARQAELLEEVFRAAMAAWRESCRERVKVRITTGRAMRGPGGEVVPLPDLVVTETLPGKGDPRYLAQALRALAEIRRLAGLETSAKSSRGSAPAPAEGRPREAADLVDPSGTAGDVQTAMRRFLSAVGEIDDPAELEFALGLTGHPVEPGEEEPDDSPPLNRAARRRQERAARKRR